MPGTLTGVVGIDSMVVVESDSYPIDGPYLWYLRMLGRSEGLPVTVAGPSPTVTGRPVLVGHGTASRSASVAVELGLPVVYISPRLDEPEVAAALAALRAPGFVAGAISDPHWDRVVAARLNPMEVLQLPTGDDRLEVEEDPLASLEVVVRVIERCRSLLRRLHRDGQITR